jgi:hypothetical protein
VLHLFEYVVAVRACPFCRRGFGLFRWRRHCFRCKRVSCAACLVGVPDQKWLSHPALADADGDGYCPECVVKHVTPVLERYDRAKQAAFTMRDWSSNYAGKVPFDWHGPSEPVVSHWFERREDAIYQLKVTAAFQGYDLLHEVTVRHRLERLSEPSYNGNGTHHYNEPRYSASAIAAKLFVPRDRESGQRRSDPP